MKKIFFGIIIGIGMSLGVAYAGSVVSGEIPSFKIFVQGEEFQSDNPPVVINGRTYLPLRDIGNALKTKVEWNSEKGQVEIGDMNIQSKEKFEFTNINIKYEYGMTKVLGEVKNIDTIKHSATVTITFYDSNKKILGTATGYINGLDGGQIKTFEGLGTEDFSKHSSYKIQVDNMF